MTDIYCGLLPKQRLDLNKIPFGSAAKPYKCCGCIERPKRSNRKRKAKRPPPSAQRMDAPYLQHLHRLCTIRKVVDNEHPPLVLNSLVKTDVVKNDWRRLEEVNAENKILLCRIDRIRRSRGVIDSYNPQAGIRSSNLGRWHRQIDKIDLENKAMYVRLKNMQPEIKNSVLLRDWKNAVLTIEGACKYPLILPGICPSDTALTSSDCMDQYRPKVFMDIAIRDGRTLGRIIILLFPDIVPITTRNFMELVHNFKREQRAKRKGLKQKFTHYVGSPVYKIYHHLYVALGDMTKENGMGGRSAFGQDFEQENFIVEANYPGMLAMIPDEEGMVNSKFLITVKPLKAMNGKRVIFGRIIKGLDCVDLIEKLSRPNGAPKEPIIIANCGLLPPRRFIKNQIEFD